MLNETENEQRGTASVGRSVVSPVLVGREPELRLLGYWISQAREGRGALMLIAGEAGVGKTRLVQELRAHALAQSFRVVEGHCFELDRTMTYAPSLDLLRAFCSTTPSDELERALSPSAAELVKLLPELGVLFPQLARAPIVVPDEQKRRLFQALLQFFERLARDPRSLEAGAAAPANILSPLLVLIEDLHWSDDTSLEFLLHLARRIRSHSILMLATYRDDETPPALEHLLAQVDRERLAVEVALKPLTREQLDPIVSAILGLTRPVRSEFLESLYALTEGNPFFIEELCKSWITAGDTSAEDNEWDRKPLTDWRA